MRLCAFTKQARFILKFNFRRFGMNLLVIIITLAGIVTYFAGYNEQISGLKYILPILV